MRIGVVWETGAARYYRAIEPMKAMMRRGHEVVWPSDADGRVEPRRLARCDVVHVYRRAAADTRRVLTDLARGDVAITYDNDDDFTAVPKESPDYGKVGGLKGRRIFAMTTKVALRARVFTTTNEVLAELYRRAGVQRVEVIPNAVPHGAKRLRSRHEGVVIGWVAGRDHAADVARIGIVDALQRVVALHPDVRVECIGVDLRLPERYRHYPHVPFGAIPRRMREWDIGIAPLADIPANWARSDIKVKEYAASSVPWLASPIGPYLPLGEEQGGRLVRDEEWFEALKRLVTRRRDRRRLARRARSWAETQTIDATADQWERVFLEAAGQVEGD